MKKLLWILVAVFALGGLALSDPLTDIRLFDPQASCIRYGESVMTGTAWELLTEGGKSVTLAYCGSPTQLIDLLQPEYVTHYTFDDGLTVTEGYSPLLTRSLSHPYSNNFQIATRDGKVLLGLPILQGGY